jgi:hypothetical protein
MTHIEGTPIAWNNLSTLHYCERAGFDYIDEGLQALATDLAAIGTDNKISIKAAKTLLLMVESAIVGGCYAEGVDHKPHVAKAESLMLRADVLQALAALFMAYVPRITGMPVDAPAEKKKESSPLASGNDGPAAI